MIVKSIRWRLLLWLAFLLVCILSGFGITAYQLHRINRLAQIDDELERRVAALGVDVRGRFGPGPPGGRRPFGPEGRHGGPEDRLVGPPPGPGPSDGGGPPPRGWPPDLRTIQVSSTTANLFTEGGTNDYYFAVWSRSGSRLKASTNLLDGVSPPRRPGADTRIHIQTRDTRREAFQFTDLGECILVGRLVSGDLRSLRLFAGGLFAAGAAVLALGLGGGWLLARGFLRPVEAIGAAARRIAAGRLSERINVRDTDSELGQLADVLNDTFTRLEAAFAQQRQFTADAAHELRTPLAVLISETQTTLARQREAAEYREAVETCLQTAQQMRHLTESLLELARCDAGQEQIQCEEVDLAQAAGECIERVRSLAGQRDIKIESDLVEARLQGDPVRLARVIVNLLTNAIHYNRDSGTIQVSCKAAEGVVTLSVADTGIGIKPEDLPHIFDRFYRADPSRVAAAGQSGLGLAIAKALVEAHKGSIDVSSRPGAGTTFVVRFPAV